MHKKYSLNDSQGCCKSLRTHIYTFFTKKRTNRRELRYSTNHKLQSLSHSLQHVCVYLTNVPVTTNSYKNDAA